MDSSSRAEQSCGACKKLKRKCDKLLPECSLCSRTGRRCDYGVASPAPSAADFAALQVRLAELEQRLSDGLVTPQKSYDPSPCRESSSGQLVASARSDEFPAALFLDIDCYKWARMRLPHPVVEIPADVLSVLTQGSSIIETSQEFFDTIHIWMLVISRKRVNLGIAVQRGGPDIAMLFLAMRLIISPPDSINAESLYSLTKSFSATLEGAGFISPQCLQALLLVALYEYSQAIYPAAWITVGVCARYLELLGISCSASRTNEITQNTTWTEVEERRRLWWGVFILDRLICAGSRRNFCLSGPPHDGLFPVDDQAWDEGDVARVQTRAISMAVEPKQPSFACLCQAALLVESAIKTTWIPPADRSNTHCSALVDQLCSFISAVDTGRPSMDQLDLSLISPSATIRSAVFLILDLFACPEKLSGQPGYVIAPGAKDREELDLQQRAMTLTIELAEHMSSLAVRLLPLVHSETDEFSHRQSSKISPLLLDAMYCSLATFYWFAAEQGDEAFEPRIRELRQFLDIVGHRWSLAHEYLSLTKYHDSTMRSSLLSEGKGT